MAYDPLTGAYSNDEKTDAAAFAQTDEIKTEETEASQDTQDTDKKEYFKEEKVPKLNKKAIIICLAAVALLLLILRFLKDSGTKTKKTPEKKQASDIIVPEFGDYKNRGYKDTPLREEAGTVSTEEDKPSAVPADYELPRPEQRSAAPKRHKPRTPTPIKQMQTIILPPALLIWLRYKSRVMKRKICRIINSVFMKRIEPSL